MDDTAFFLLEKCIFLSINSELDDESMLNNYLLFIQGLVYKDVGIIFGFTSLIMLHVCSSVLLLRWTAPAYNWHICGHSGLGYYNFIGFW